MKTKPQCSSFFVVSLLLAFVCMPSTAAADAAADVSTNDPYVRAVPPGQTNSAAFLKIKNSSDVHHAVVGASTQAAKMVELHTHIMEGEMMKMRRIDKIDLPPNTEATLQPGGMHLMFMGLKQDLKPGEIIAITLTFEDGSQQEFQAEVRKLKMKMKMNMGNTQ